MYTSDNGYLLGQHRLTGKVLPYDESVEVPMLVRGPRDRSRRHERRLVGNVDLAATFAELAGTRMPYETDGRSFAWMLSARYPAPSRWRDMYYITAGTFDGVRTTNEAYFRYRSGNREYYDLRRDPHQVDNAHGRLAPARQAAFEAAIGRFLTCAGTSCHDAEEFRSVLFVTGGDDRIVSDRTFRAHLEAAGWEVQVVDDDRAAAVALDGIRGVFVSSSVVPAKVGAAFKAAAVPVVSWEGHLFDDMGWATSSKESAVAQTKVAVADPGHPLAAGLTGSPDVYTSPAKLSVGFVGSAAHVVARDPSTPARATVFAYDAGSVLADGTIAPAARIGLFPTFEGLGLLSDAGWTIVDAAIAEAVGVAAAD